MLLTRRSARSEGVGRFDRAASTAVEREVAVHPAPPPSTQAGRRTGSMLALATVGYLVSAWAWALLAPLAPLLRDTLRLTVVEQAMVVSVPVVVGALGRIPVGTLTDRLGARAMFLVVTAATIVALLVLAAVGYRSVPGLMIGAAFLGVAGTMFAVGVPFVSAWFADGPRGLALGVLGTGLIGGAIGGLTTVRLVRAHGIAAPFWAAAFTLGLFAVLVLVMAHDPPRLPSHDAGVSSRFAVALRLPITWQATLWNAVTFAMFVTFSSYLPIYLTNAYGLALDRTGYAMAGFIILAVPMRAVGGWLSDRLTPRRPLITSLAVLVVVTAAQVFTPPLPIVLTVLLPVLAVALGITSGAILAQVAAVAPPAMIGRVSGIVAGVAGMAGFASPLLMAASLGRHGGYGLALGVLAAGAAAALLSAITGTRPSVA
jgi:MFS transporter, NNP family, nitrate/nitrite transporter